MNKAALYSQFSNITRRDIINTLQKSADVFKWRSDGSDSALDAGCGPGNITHDILLPFLPSNCKRLVGVDVSKEMIRYARETVINPKLSFEEFDLNIQLEKQNFASVEPFDHIFSFYTLMWVPDQKMCMQNFNKLLRPDGDMLLLVLGDHPIYDCYREQSQNTEWAQYMTDVEQLISPYHSSGDPKRQLLSVLNECGFTECDVRIYNETYTHTFESMYNLVYAVNPFVDRVPAQCQQKYIDDVVQRFAKKCRYVDESVMDIKANRFILSYKLILAYAKKKHNL